MKIPNCDNAIIPKAKITDYLLSLTHEDGRSKAQFFRLYGFSEYEWQDLATALKEHAGQHFISIIEDSPFGKRYVIEGKINTPDGQQPFIRSVWFIRHEEDLPRFVTAYPIRRKKHERT